MEMQLLDAARNGDVDGVRRLVGHTKYGVDPDTTDTSSGMTPLHLACENGHVAVVKYLLQEVQVDVERKSRGGWTALHSACCDETNGLSMVRYLVETGDANIEAKTDSGSTPLHCASFQGCGDIVQYLVEHRQANVNARDSFGDTPLDDAIISEKEDIIRCVLPRTSSVATKTLVRLWKHDRLWEIREAVLQKYAFGQGLANAFFQNPIHTILLHFPLPTVMAFQDSIELFPYSFLSLMDEQGRLSIHVALTSQNGVVRSPSIVASLFHREPRSVLARDPTTGLYPHETAAGLASNETNDKEEDSWLDVVYKILRSDPHELLQSRLQSMALQNVE